MSIRISFRSCHQPQRSHKCKGPIHATSHPNSSVGSSSCRGSDGPANIDWPIVAVAAAFALLFVVGITVTAGLPACGSPGTIGRSSPGPVSKGQRKLEAKTPPQVEERLSRDRAVVSETKPDAATTQVTENTLGTQTVLLPVSPDPTARFSREGGEAVGPVMPRRAAEFNPATSCRETFGTSVEFVSRPTLAARQAREDQKLLYVLHLSGNFENDRFT